MRCSCLFIILGAGWGLRGHGGGRGPGQPPAQPASPAARLSLRMGGRRSRFLGRRAALAGCRLSPPPLTTPPPAPRSLLSPSWFPRPPPASGPPGDPRPGPRCCEFAGRGRPQVVPRSSSPQRPAQPWWREAGASVTLKGKEEGLPISIPIPKAGLQP
nr:basic proline-rich protein-like [Chlorocebus sabaeus]